MQEHGQEHLNISSTHSLKKYKQVTVFQSERGQMWGKHKTRPVKLLLF